MESKISARSKTSDAKAILYRVVVFVGLLVLISFLLEGCNMKSVEKSPVNSLINDVTSNSLEVLSL